MRNSAQSVTYPSTRKLAYQYDAAGRLKAVGDTTVGADRNDGMFSGNP